MANNKSDSPIELLGEVLGLMLDPVTEKRWQEIYDGVELVETHKSGRVTVRKFREVR